MVDFTNLCFVCGCEIDPQLCEKNLQVNLPVCVNCKGTDREHQAVEDLLDELADGFVCGCI